MSLEFLYVTLIKQETGIITSETFRPLIIIRHFYVYQI